MYVVKVNSTATNDGQAHFVRDTLESATALAQDLDGKIYECLPVGAMLEVEQLQARVEALEAALRHIVGRVDLWNSNKFGSANFQRQRWQSLGKAAAAALGEGGE